MKLEAKQRRRGWTFYCHECRRGFMTRGPMLLHLMAKVHGITMYQAYEIMNEAEDRAR